MRPFHAVPLAASLALALTACGGSALSGEGGDGGSDVLLLIPCANAAPLGVAGALANAGPYGLGGYAYCAPGAPPTSKPPAYGLALCTCPCPCPCASEEENGPGSTSASGWNASDCGRVGVGGELLAPAQALPLRAAARLGEVA